MPWPVVGMWSRHHACLLCCVHSIRLARVLLPLFVLTFDGRLFLKTVENRLRDRPRSGLRPKSHQVKAPLHGCNIIGSIVKLSQPRLAALNVITGHSGQECMDVITRLINELYVEFLYPCEQYTLAATESQTWWVFVLRYERQQEVDDRYWEMVEEGWFSE